MSNEESGMRIPIANNGSQISVNMDSAICIIRMILDIIPPHNFDLHNNVLLTSDIMLKLSSNQVHYNEDHYFVVSPLKSTDMSNVKSFLSMIPINKRISRTFCGRTISLDSSQNIRQLNRKNIPSSSMSQHLYRYNWNKTQKLTEKENRSSRRNARANKRRNHKNVVSFGKLAPDPFSSIIGREKSLRFDKSTIHGWGIFTDEFINSGDFIVEYRGVLIRNVLADKRERDYEKSKTGSDYMFRVNSDIVCDATFHGNVARFINASCDPNCYTQIISFNGQEKIAIYAKKNINRGEELCYDYKFENEHDLSKRIPCHCGSDECRGFMNWDKRYVSVLTRE